MKKAILALLLAAGCAAAQSLPPLPADDTCGAAQFADVIGQDATTLERVLYLGKLRILRPKTAMTMDFQPDRINIQIDDADQIVAITCG